MPSQNTVSMAIEASKGICSDALTLPTSNWLFYFEVGTYSAILHIALSPVHSNVIAPSLYI